MKINLTVEEGCNQIFLKDDGSKFLFPGQELEVFGGPSESEKCNNIYIGPGIVDKLDCEPVPPDSQRDSYQHIGIGSEVTEPPTEGEGGSGGSGGCEFVLTGSSWNYTTNPGGNVAMAGFTNEGPDMVVVTNLQAAGQIVEAYTFPMSILPGQGMVYTYVNAVSPFTGALVSTTCGQFQHPFGNGGDFYGPLPPV